MSISSVTTRSWLPARHPERASTAVTQASGLGPYPTRSPKHQISSVPVASMSSSTASRAGKFAWTSEMTATRIE